MSYKISNKTGLILVAIVLVISWISPVAMAFADTCTAYTTSVTSNETTLQSDGNAAVATYQSSLWAPAFPAAEWIWSSPMVQNPQAGETQTFVSRFTLPGAPASSTLEISADDYYTIAINGIQVAANNGEGNFLPSNVHQYAIAQYLSTGANSITFTVTNAPYFYSDVATSENNPAGLLFRIDIEGSVCESSNSASTGGGGGNGMIYQSGPQAPGFQVQSATIVPASLGTDASNGTISTGSSHVLGESTSTGVMAASGKITPPAASTTLGMPLLVTLTKNNSVSFAGMWGMINWWLLLILVLILIAIYAVLSREQRQQTQTKV